MKPLTIKCLLSVTLTALLAGQSVSAAANNVALQNRSQSNAIEKIIRQHISLGRMKNKYFHPIIAKSKGRATPNPFAKVSKEASIRMAKAGINLSIISRYKAIYLSGEYLGSQSRKIIHTEPNVVLVIGKGMRTHDPIYSRGPVYVLDQADNVGGIISNNLVWFDDRTNKNLPDWGSFIGIPAVLRGNSAQPNIVAAPQYKLNRLTQVRRDECNSYVQGSINQNSQNKALQCGFTGLRWSNNRKGQFDWCMTVLNPLTLEETSFRKDRLEQCKADKSSAKNPKNRPAIPARCDDPSKQYGAVKQINHSYRYEQKPTTVVQNGLIRYDYNADKRHDYVFLEAKGENSRAVICLSNGDNYRRHVTDITINSGRGLGNYDYRINQSGATLAVDIQYFEHNAGSSHSNTSYQFQHNTGKFKITNTDSGAYGVEQDGFTYPMPVPPSPALF